LLFSIFSESALFFSIFSQKNYQIRKIQKQKYKLFVEGDSTIETTNFTKLKIYIFYFYIIKIIIKCCDVFSKLGN
jgi:hypothetical protein